jgi:hypothetical protein
MHSPKLETARETAKYANAARKRITGDAGLATKALAAAAVAAAPARANETLA